MDRRRSPRVPAPADVKGGVILIEHLDIVDLSLSGVRFNCTRRLTPGQTLNLALCKGSLRVELRGKVHRSKFLGITQIMDRAHHSYEVALSFEGSADDRQRLLALMPLAAEKKPQ